MISEKLHKRTEFGVNHFAGCVSESDKLLVDRKKEMEHEIALLKEEHSTKIKMLSDELHKT